MMPKLRAHEDKSMRHMYIICSSSQMLDSKMALLGDHPRDLQDVDHGQEIRELIPYPPGFGKYYDPTCSVVSAFQKNTLIATYKKS